FHFFDDAGNPQGMASDYLHLLMEKTGLKTDVQKNLPWPEVLKKAREKEIDLITCAAITPERESYLLFSKPYLSFPLVIISRKDSPFIGGIGDLQGMKVAFVTDNVVYQWMRNDRIDMTSHFVPTPLDALQAVSLGRADAHIDNLAAASFLIEKYGLANLKIAAPTPYQNYTLHVAVRKDWPELVTIIDRAIDGMTPDQHAAIRNRWLTVRYEHGISPSDIWKRTLMIAIPAFVVIGGIFFWNRRLQQEIRNRRKAEKALRENEEQLRMITDNTGSLIAVLDNRWRYEFVSPSHQILGYEPGDLIGTSGFSLIHPDDIKAVAEILKHEISGKLSGTTAAYRAIGKDGRVYDIEGTFDTIRNNSGTLEKIVFVGDDVTSRKQADQEKATIEAQNQQIQKAESLGRMAGAIAHHFNNQLQAVMGNLDMAMSDLQNGKTPVDKLTRAIRSARKASDVSGLMLTYLGQTSGRNDPMDLSDVCRRSLSMLQAVMPDNLVLNTDLPESGPVIIANATHIRQLLSHLVINACESMSGTPGAVHLTVKTVSPETIPNINRFPIGWKPGDQDYACIAVTDFGCGIAEQEIGKLFDPFFTTKFMGRGLGLSIILGIVRATGGAVTVESKPGKGSVFKIFFPASGQTVLPLSDISGNPDPVVGDKTILVVEDEEMVRDMLAVMLSQMGLTVLHAGDGIEAVEIFRQHPDEIHCVLTDLTMPRMGGWEVISALREIRPDIPFILASGCDEAQVMAGEHPEWPQAFLKKPYRYDDLREAIGRVLAAACRE
ncbi:MAG: transporter substrate-binding domain-containing protein, partial [Desulfatirhabdiaceae bacterium]